MKKFIIILIIVLTNIFGVIASPVNNITLKKDSIIAAYNLKDSVSIERQFKINSLYKYLDLTPEQYEDFFKIHDNINNSIEDLKVRKEKAAKLFNNSMVVRLKDAHYILTPEQYRKYLRVLNITLSNKKLSQYIN